MAVRSHIALLLLDLDDGGVHHHPVSFHPIILSINTDDNTLGSVPGDRRMIGRLQPTSKLVSWQKREFHSLIATGGLSFARRRLAS
jgi:hypothetical protein